MTHPFPARLAGRIKWFGQLSAALDEAQQLLTQLGSEDHDLVEVSKARAEVLALSGEIELLRGEGFLGQKRIAADPLPPNWRGSAA